MIDEIIDVLNNLKSHIIYDKNIKQICYSAKFIKAKNEIIRILDNNKKNAKRKLRRDAK